MISLQSLTTKLLYATARLTCDNGKGASSVGTAFFFTFKLDDQRSVPVLVTNKHVVKDSVLGEFFLHKDLVSMELGPHPKNGSAVSEASRHEDPEEPGEVDRRIAFDTAV